MVVFCVLTVVMMVSTMVVLSCLKRETKKFKKRLGKMDSKKEVVRDIPVLEGILVRYVSHQLAQGMMKKMANSFDTQQKRDEGDTIR